ncbi:MAG: hypothetical protein A2591_03950 [Candidatus Yonathbacteria bacterium RIFOXYD1_FULL_52_36]|uniref:DUF4015 domain-containing protein n=1 Tax=Candidatus Yonathbacteria bacterium RIFOXYD1_FULL_52_36 TaxID=1802730 RepID=A0A1G2SJL5_9BACT|nr:MAG: hypothetical protein A2591_03950 [Candidatus Yonathbacteria bacterium RIFOXYD1_FULL_52_36]
MNTRQSTNQSFLKKSVLISLVLTGAFSVVAFALPSARVPAFDRTKPTATSTDSSFFPLRIPGMGEPETVIAPVPQVPHVATPDAVKAIYMSSWVAGTPTFRSKLVKIADETEVNALVIDIKDYTGKIAFPVKDPLLVASGAAENRVPDMEEFLKTLHEKNIYVIGRIAVFQDPYYVGKHPELAIKRLSDGGVWKDHKGLPFIDVGSREYWDYIVALAKESHDMGFDEINFDYIRFPSDGNMRDIKIASEAGTTKPEILESFFKYLHEQLAPEGIVTSADLFGMTTTNTDDLNIGQQLERALPYFDFIAPMVYPSHYPPKFNGWADPNDHPYELIKFVMEAAVRRTIATTTPVPTIGAERVASTSPQLYTKPAFSAQKMRPWLQDFDYGGTYGPAEVRGQIQATYDAGLTSWMLWDPSNKYTPEALRVE